MAMNQAEIVKDKDELIWKGVRSAIYYKQRFEDAYRAHAISHYEQEANRWVNTMSCPEYTKVASESFKREEDIAARLLVEESRKSFIRQLVDKLINAHVEELVDMDKTGVKDMLGNKRNAELKALTELLTRSPGTFALVVDRFQPYILARGKAVRENKELKEDPAGYIKALVDLRSEIEALIAESFASMDSFSRSNDIAFQEILESFDLTPKYLAYYIDTLMRVGLKGKEAEMETLIDSFFILFKLLKSKDAFAEHHKSLYAMRLLQRSSVSDAAEDLLISKMKIELGTQYVAKYVQMGVDMKNSKEQTEAFQRLSHGGVIGNVELNVKVLTSGLWEYEKSAGIKFPPELVACCEQFEHFYKQVHTGRHLVWSSGLGDCEVKTHGLAKPYTFIVSVYQASVLMLFNDRETYLFKDLVENTGIPPTLLEKQMFNLANPRMGKLLAKANLKTPNFALDEKVTLNTEFAAVSLRLSLVPILRRKRPELSKEHDSELREINKQRAAVLQTTIVKIMKGRKQEKHNELIAEVIKMTQAFKPDPAMIKQQIEWLIESDYLMRSTDDRYSSA